MNELARPDQWWPGRWRRVERDRRVTEHSPMRVATLWELDLDHVANLPLPCHHASSAPRARFGPRPRGGGDAQRRGRREISKTSKRDTLETRAGARLGAPSDWLPRRLSRPL